MAFIALTPAEVDAKSPIDDFLMGKIKDDLDDLDARVVNAGAAPYVFELTGRLDYIADWKRSICAGILNEAFTPSRCRYLLKKGGTSGTLAFDIRRHTTPKTPIRSILHQYVDSTSSIARVGTGLTTQSIARAVVQIATQSITHAKAAVNITSIISLGTIEGVGTNLWQYNFDAALDSDTVVNDSIVFASATSGANNGTFTILEKGHGGDANVVISNASGVAQTGAAGTAQVKIMSYNFTNPVDTLGYIAGYSAIFAAHTSGANDGTRNIYAVNSGGNNVWVKNSAGVVQGGVAGNANTLFWVFALASAALATNYVAGEAANTSGHTSGANDGNFTIIAVNSGGNNLVLYNTAGVVQGGVAGTINSNRWKYGMPTDPSSQVVAGYKVYAVSHSTAANNGDFTVVDINNGGNNIVIYNVAGVAQGGAAGTVNTTRKVVAFTSDQSAVYTIKSFVEFQGCANRLYNYADFFSPLQVVEINRGGGANYNIVVDMPTGRTSVPQQLSPAGYVQIEMKSLFDTATPTLAVDLSGVEPNHDLAGTSVDLLATVVPAQTPFMLYLLSVPSGKPEDLTVILR